MKKIYSVWNVALPPLNVPEDVKGYLRELRGPCAPPEAVVIAMAGADTENLLDCQHVHDEDCGYVQANPGQSCGYECRICPIEDLIAALPDTVMEDNADNVRAQLDHILALYGELSWEEQERIDLSRVYELQGALDGANDPDPVEGEVSADYQEASWNNSGVIYTTKTAANCTPVTDSTTEWNAGWYAVSGNVTISEPITVTGAVNLILTDGCDLTAAKGIVVTTGNSLTIYAQSDGTGTLNATGTVSGQDSSAGIGGSATSFDSGSITIHGGVINAASGEGYYAGAGIGGGSNIKGDGGTGNDITIYGGSVTAESRSYEGGGAGVGGGAGGYNGGAGNITIRGGTVRATGGCMDTGLGGAGIGGGTGGMSQQSGNGTVTISGGKVTAVGGSNAAGIGGGGGYQGSYISLTGGTGSVTISGGIVDASSPTDVYYKGYEGAPIGNGGNASGTATVNKTTGIVFENGAGTVCGDVVLNENYVQTLVNRYTLLDHMDREQSGRTELCVGDFKIDLMRRQVFLKEEKIELSGKEFDLLLFFAQNPNRVLTEAQIYDRVWNTDKDFHSSIAKPINRLRQKIEPDQRNPVYIRSIRGVGYQFAPNIVTSCDI